MHAFWKDYLPPGELQKCYQDPCLCLFWSVSATATICRDSVSENVDRKQTDLFEEIGVDTDEMTDVDYKSFERLLPKKTRV